MLRSTDQFLAGRKSTSPGSSSFIATVVTAGAIGLFVLCLVLIRQFSVVIAIALACNFYIMGMAAIRLYERDLLLTPTAIFIGMSIATYSIGNVGALVEIEESWNELHPGAAAYYPAVGILSTIGLAIYFAVVSRMFALRPEARSNALPLTTNKMLLQIQRRVSYTGVFLSLCLAFGVIAYLSAQYTFTGGYFREVESQFDKFLASTMYVFAFLAAVICVCAAAKTEQGILRNVARVGLAALFILVVGMRSRTTMLMFVFFVGLLWLSLRPFDVKKVFVAAVGATVAVYALGTIVKFVSMSEDATVSILGNVELLGGQSVSSAGAGLSTSLDKELGRRLTGFEFPAALMMAQDNGAQPLYGEGLSNAVLGWLPSALRPKGEYSERIAIWENANRYGLVFGDVPGITMSTGIAELGLLGAFPVYALLAFWHVAIWGVARRSPLLFLSYLAQVPALINSDLLWDSMAESLRLWLFVIVVLLLIRPLVLPGFSVWDKPKPAM